MTGAEKPRSSEATGAASSASKVQDCCAESSTSTRSEPATGVPSACSRPIATGITKGHLSVWPGVAGVCCDSVSVQLRVSASKRPAAFRRGVPACAYQRLKASSRVASALSGLASAMACAKSSQVTAWPSWRAKYRSMPRRKPLRPTSVAIMRTTSAPLS